ncbi:hypothetical protein [Vibrio sp. WXL103]|uniref:hypothetical protein n=1 Tax=Vibrio sp. WXL103 TaxID=3450710 RepID=UPI003EC7A70A
MLNRTSWNKGREPGVLGDTTDTCSPQYQQEPQLIYQAHAASQLELGEGRDRITLNEPRRPQTSILEWPNLLTLDIAYWNRQLHEINKLGQSDVAIGGQDSEHGLNITAPDGYLNQLRGEWIRLFYYQRFVYGNLYSALHYIMYKALVEVAAWLHARYPFQFLSRHQLLPHDGAKLASESALHQEGQFSYESLKAYFISHYSEWINAHYFELIEELNTHLNQQTPATYVIEYLNSQGLPCVDFVCKNQQAMRLVRTEYFVEDMLSMKCDSQYLDFKIQQLAAKIENEIRSLGW